MTPEKTTEDFDWLIPHRRQRNEWASQFISGPLSPRSTDPAVDQATETDQAMTRKALRTTIDAGFRNLHPDWTQSQVDDASRRMRLSYTAGHLNKGPVGYNSDLSWMNSPMAAEDEDFGVITEDKTLRGGAFTNENRWTVNPYSTAPEEDLARQRDLLTQLESPDIHPDQVTPLLSQWESIDNATAGRRKRHEFALERQRINRVESSVVRLEDPTFGSVMWGDVAQSVPDQYVSREIIGGLVYGISDAALSINNFRRYLSGYPTVETNLHRGELPTSVSISSGIIQFVLPFSIAGKMRPAIAAGKWLSGTRASIAVGKSAVGKFVAASPEKFATYVAQSGSAAVAGGVVDFLAFDPSLGNLSTMLKANGWSDGFLIDNLDSKMITEEHGQTAGRLVQMVEGALLGTVVDFLIAPAAKGAVKGTVQGGKWAARTTGVTPANLGDVLRYTSTMMGGGSEDLIARMPAPMRNMLINKETARSLAELVAYGARKTAYAAELANKVKDNGTRYTEAEIAQMSALKHPASEFVNGIERVHTAMVMQSFNVDHQTARDLVRITGSDKLRRLFVGGGDALSEADMAEMAATARTLSEESAAITATSDTAIRSAVDKLTDDQLKAHFAHDSRLSKDAFDAKRLRTILYRRLRTEHGVAAAGAAKQYPAMKPLEAGGITISKETGEVTLQHSAQKYAYATGADGKPMKRGTPEYAARRKEIADSLSQVFRDVEKSAAAGDPKAQAMLAQRGWYTKFQKTLQPLTDPELAKDWSDIFAAFSANTKWADNEAYAMEFLPKFVAGEYDDALVAWKKFRGEQAAWDAANEAEISALKSNGVRAADAEKQARAATTARLQARPEANKGMYIKRPGDKLYGINSEKAMDSLVGLWEIKAGDAPKIASFAASLREGNLAVVDLWMGRLGDMLTNNRPSIPDRSAGVRGDFVVDASGKITTDNEYGMMADVLEDTARTLGWVDEAGNPDIKGVQASSWFWIKEQYEARGYQKDVMGGTPRITGAAVAGEAGQYVLITPGRIIDPTTGRSRLPSTDNELRTLTINTRSGTTGDATVTLASRADVLAEFARAMGASRRAGLDAGSRSGGEFGIAVRRIGAEDSAIGGAYTPSVFEPGEIPIEGSVRGGQLEPYADINMGEPLPTSHPVLVAIADELKGFYISPSFVRMPDGTQAARSLSAQYIPDLDPVVMDAVANRADITPAALKELIDSRRKHFKETVAAVAAKHKARASFGRSEVTTMTSGDIESVAALSTTERRTVIDENTSTVGRLDQFTGDNATYGFSYSATTLSPQLRDGYMVGVGTKDVDGTVHPERTKRFDHQPTVEELRAFNEANAEMLAGKEDLFVGGWRKTKDKIDPATGKPVLDEKGNVVPELDAEGNEILEWYDLDLSERILDEAEAHRVGAERGEHSILDNRDFSSVKVKPQGQANAATPNPIQQGANARTDAGAVAGTSQQASKPITELSAEDRLLHPTRRQSPSQGYNSEYGWAEHGREWLGTDDPLKRPQTGRTPVLFEVSDGSPRGVHVSDGRASFIRGVNNPDAVTATHEIAHAIRVLNIDRSAPMSERVLSDEMMDAVEREFGVIGGEWTVEAEEKFAQAFVGSISTAAYVDGIKDPVTKQAVLRLGATLRDMHLATRGSLPEANPVVDALLQKLAARSDLPIQYAPGKWMDQINFKELITAIEESQKRGDNDWLRLISPEDVLGTARMHSFPNDGQEFFKDPTTGAYLPASNKDKAFAATGGEKHVRDNLRFFDSEDDALRFFAYFDQLAKKMEESAGLRNSSAMKLLKKDGLALFTTYLMKHGDDMSTAMESLYKNSVAKGGIAGAPDHLPRFAVTLQLAVRDRLELAQGLAKKALASKSPLDFMEMQRAFVDLQKLRFQILKAKSSAGRFLRSWDPNFIPSKVDTDEFKANAEEAAAWLKERGLDERVGEALADTLVSLDLSKDIERAIAVLDAPRGARAWGVRSKQIITDIMINGMLSMPRTFLTLQAVSTPIMLGIEGVQKFTGALMSGDVGTAALTARNVAVMSRQMLDALYFGGRSFAKEKPTLLRSQESEDWFSVSEKDNQFRNIALYWMARGGQAAITLPSRFIGSIDEAWKQAAARTYILEKSYRDIMTKRAKDAKVTGWFANAQFIKENHAAVAEEAQREMESLIEDGRLLDAQGVLEKAYNDPVIKAETDPVRRSHMIMDYASKNWSAQKRNLTDGAERAAREATYTESLRGWTRSVGAASNRHFWLKTILPFWKVPVNIYRRMSGYALSPVMFGGDLATNIITKGKFGFNPNSKFYAMHQRTMTDMLSGDPSKVARARGQVAVGAAMVYGGWELYQSGTITGAGPADPEQRRLWTQSGRQPYSIKIGDSWVSYKKIEPFGSLLGILTDYHELTDGAYMASEEDQVTAVTAAVYAFSSASVNKSYMQGISDLIDAMHDSDKMEMWLARQATVVMPYSNLQRGLVRANDANSYDVRASVDESDDITGILGEFASLIKNEYGKMSVFGDRSDLVRHYSVLGEPIKSHDPLDGSVFSSMAYQLLSPASSTPENKDPVINALVGIRGSVWRPVAKTREGVVLTDIDIPPSEWTLPSYSDDGTQTDVPGDGARSAYDYYNAVISTIRQPVPMANGKTSMLTLHEALSGMLDGKIPELAAAWEGASRGDDVTGDFELRRKLVGDIVGMYREQAWIYITPDLDENLNPLTPNGSPTLSHALATLIGKRDAAMGRAVEAEEKKRTELEQALEATR